MNIFIILIGSLGGWIFGIILLIKLFRWIVKKSKKTKKAGGK